MSEVIYVDEIVGTNAYIDGVLQPKKEGATYRVETVPNHPMARFYSGFLKGLAMAIEEGDRVLTDSDAGILKNAAVQIDAMYEELNDE